ncbi:cytochrome b5 reductase 4 [Lingula anatina]|uniref:Cytochrome b5 reductase 4 n=1 Tax=Lingula anatina TaxID=7574 RepID=A0A1S3JWM9_LINAN|nr:cytochrome b5 reductase 4 [Lingula anatina]|eukprot:XP_013414778.1 cytochrome b5 reductase 4 [Lingula anatina]
MSKLTAPQFPAPFSAQRAGVSGAAGRHKVALKPGRSLMDWVRLTKSGKDLTGTGGRSFDVTTEELAKHNTVNNCWMAVRGKVYNITPYFEYHPGGVDELMKGAGKDGTQLFDEVHKWVNIESMLESCYIGKLKATPVPVEKSGSPLVKKLYSSLLSAKGHMPPPAPPPIHIPEEKPSPRLDWFQNDSSVTLTIYTRWNDILREHVIIDKKGQKLQAAVVVKDMTYMVHLDLANEVHEKCGVRVSKGTGKLEIILRKVVEGRRWLALGDPLEGHNTYEETGNKEAVFRECKVLSIEPVSHDTHLYCVQLPEGCRMSVPIGHHVHIKANIEGMSIVRSYTPVTASLQYKVPPQLEDIQDEIIYLMIKIYPGGALTPAIDRLVEGSKVLVSNYEGNYQESHMRDCSHLILLAAGTGFTPMVKIIYKNLIEEWEGSRQIKLVFFNKTEKDILWRNQLELLAQENPRFGVFHILSEADDNWDGLRGRIRKEILESFIPPIGEGKKVMICACGPSPFTEEAIRLVQEMGYSLSRIHPFMG